MERFFPLAALVFFGLFTGSVCAQVVPSSAEQAIRPQMAKMFKTANVHDTGAFMAKMVRSPSLVFAINGGVIHGWRALHAQQPKWWRNGESDAKHVQNGVPAFVALGSEVEIVGWPLASSRTDAGGNTRASAFVVT